MKQIVQIKRCPKYYITNDGCVYSMYYGYMKQMKPRASGHGYLQVDLHISKNNVKKMYVHRLVAETFIPNPDNKPQVNHKNGDKTDNRVENLEFCTASENQKHQHLVLGHKSPMFGRKGKDSPYSKIVLQIKNNKIVKEFYGTLDAERELGIRHQRISACCCGKTKTAGGFEWKYKD